MATSIASFFSGTEPNQQTAAGPGRGLTNARHKLPCRVSFESSQQRSCWFLLRPFGLYSTGLPGTQLGISIAWQDKATKCKYRRVFYGKNKNLERWKKFKDIIFNFNFQYFSQNTSFLELNPQLTKSQNLGANCSTYIHFCNVMIVCAKGNFGDRV